MGEALAAGADDEVEDAREIAGVARALMGSVDVSGELGGVDGTPAEGARDGGAAVGDTLEDGT